MVCWWPWRRRRPGPFRGILSPAYGVLSRPSRFPDLLVDLAGNAVGHRPPIIRGSLAGHSVGPPSLKLPDRAVREQQRDHQTAPPIALGISHLEGDLAELGQIAIRLHASEGG